MAVLCGLSLRVSWISCLLISSVTCLPSPRGHGAPAPMGYMGWLSNSGSSFPNAGKPDSSASLSRESDPTSGSMWQVPAAQNSYEKLGSVSEGGSFSDPQASGYFSGGDVTDAGVRDGEYYAPTDSYGSSSTTWNDASTVGSGYDNSGYANAGVGWVGSPNSWSTGEDGGYAESYVQDEDDEESPEPVLSDLSALEPVYSFRSRRATSEEYASSPKPATLLERSCFLLRRLSSTALYDPSNLHPKAANEHLEK
ncbi:uncharacterized protein LOC129115791 [Anoplopoma fimbria]|uniref:uncharacterized protein LOC129115791 n=1 Tax=Anoplopoma fimbria TaxID=229290 RepID=UPI0023EBB6D8|nr:uncharacterized protein LOC129115791 [Anoplopoma fimbria]